jgi:eukaryotic-like serine/threonine-protein kinase
MHADGSSRQGFVVGGAYRLEHEIGRGGMASVHAARHLTTSELVAVKLLETHDGDDPMARRRFTREAANAMRIVHPLAVRTLAVGEGDSYAWMAMEYVHGRTLHAVVESDGCCEPSTVVAYVQQAADVLDHVHRLGIVHRDVKPGNIMITDRDPLACVRLLDFGLARELGNTAHDITIQGTAAGTPGFMAPEQRAGLQPDRRADVFSLAAVAAFLLAGRMPVASWALPLRPEMFGRRRRWSDAVDRVLSDALTADPVARTGSAGAFATAFARAVQSNLTGPP